MPGPDGGDTNTAPVPATTAAKPQAFHDQEIYGWSTRCHTSFPPTTPVAVCRQDADTPSGTQYRDEELMNVTQVLSPASTTPHSVTRWPVCNPVSEGGKFKAIPSFSSTIHELLFRVEKDSSVFWVGAAVPFGTIDFTKAQVFFHPTVIQQGVVRAADADYPEFKNGWPNTMQRYTEMEGCQLAGGRLTTLLVPFTPMGALSSPSQNMFSSDPIGTINAIMAAVKDAVAPFAPVLTNIASIGVTSFSSGITAMRLFINHLSPTGLVREVTDLDSPYIVAEPKALTSSPGAVSRCYTQHPLPSPPLGWITLPAAGFLSIPNYPANPGDPDPLGSHAHACIGFMMYYSAILTSVIV
jgi:hypothetical protein